MRPGLQHSDNVLPRTSDGNCSLSEASATGAGARIRRGGLWLLAGRSVNAFLRVASSAALSHFLLPDDFGMMGIIMVLLVGLDLLSDTGAHPSVVRCPNGAAESFLSTVFTIQVIRGLLLYAVCIIVAGPFSRIYGSDEIERLLPWAGLMTIISGARSAKLFLADRNLDQMRPVVAGLTAQFMGSAVTVYWAWRTRSIDALIGGTLTSAAFYALLTHLILPGPGSRFRLDRESVREIFRFGRWILLSTILMFIGTQGDRLVIGALMPPDSLGFFFIAAAIAEVLLNVQGMISSSLLFPALAEANRMQDTRLHERHRKAQGLLNAAGLAGVVGIATLTPTLIRNLYADEYSSVIPYTQLLCLPTWLMLLKSSATSVALAIGDSKALTISNSVLILTKIPLAVAGLLIFGVPGMILGMGVGCLLHLVPLYAAIHTSGMNIWKYDLMSTGWGILLVSLGVFAPMVVTREPGWIRSVIEIVTMTCLTAGILRATWPHWRQLWR